MLVVTSAAGCRDTMLVPIPVSFTPPVAAYTHLTPECTQQTDFTNLSTPGLLYGWNFGDNSTSTLVNPTHQYQNPGSYTVTLIVSTIDGCGDTTSNTVVIDPLPYAYFVPNIDTCQLNATFNNSSLNAASYSWNFGDNTTSNSVNPTHTYTQTGTYPVTLVVTDVNGCTDTMVQYVSPYILANADFTFAVDTCMRQVNFFNLSDLALNYQWNFGDGNTSDNISASHQFTDDGNYSVLLITNPGTVCADTAKIVVDYSLAGIGSIWVPNAFTPNNDGKNDVWEIVGYFPCEDLTLYIFNRWGELIYQTNELPLRWDGKYSDDKVKLEVYVYILESEHVNEVGRVTVIR
jgi:gliding motility-associated-like protein